MATSVSSERAFSSSAITISKQRNRLSSNIVEALQCLKCFIQRDLLFHEALDPSVLSELGEEDAVEVGSDDAVVSEENGGLEVDLVDSDSDIIVSGFE